MAAPACCRLLCPVSHEEAVSINAFAKKAFLIEKFALLAYKANLLKGKKHRKEHNYTAQP